MFRFSPAKKIAEFLNVDLKIAKEIRKLIKECPNRDRDIEDTLQEIDVLMEGCGVEAIEHPEYDYYVSQYWDRTIAIYVNTGDTYNATVLFDTENRRFLLTTWGGFYEPVYNRACV